MVAIVREILSNVVPNFVRKKNVERACFSREYGATFQVIEEVYSVCSQRVPYPEAVSRPTTTTHRTPLHFILIAYCYWGVPIEVIRLLVSTPVSAVAVETTTGNILPPPCQPRFPGADAMRKVRSVGQDQSRFVFDGKSHPLDRFFF